MPRFIPIGLAAGLATALLYASSGAGGMGGRIILFFLAPLPCYLAGLALGVPAAAIAAVTAALATGLLLGPRTGAVSFLSEGIPAVVLCYLTLLTRPATASPGNEPSPFGMPGTTAPAAPAEWYPPGRILAAAAVMAGVLAFISLMLLGGDVDSLRRLIRNVIDKVLVDELPGFAKGQLTDADKGALARILLHALPAASGVVWLAGFMLNLWLAAKVTQISGRLPRPWPDVRLMRFPAGFGLLLALVLVAAFLPGMTGLFATGFAGAFLFAYLLMGLAIIHYATRDMPSRRPILWAVYLSLLVFNTWAGVIVALIAILEPLLWYRRPATEARPPPGSPPPEA